MEETAAAFDKHYRSGAFAKVCSISMLRLALALMLRVAGYIKLLHKASSGVSRSMRGEGLRKASRVPRGLQCHNPTFRRELVPSSPQAWNVLRSIQVNGKNSLEISLLISEVMTNFSYAVRSQVAF